MDCEKLQGLLGEDFTTFVIAAKNGEFDSLVDVQQRQAERDAVLDKLSNREREVLDLIVQGYRAGAIAKKSFVSMSTVRTQIRSILAKLKVSSQLEAVAFVRYGRPEEKAKIDREFVKVP
jgi:DNA-binding NarL/FixJ family response regulator